MLISLSKGLRLTFLVTQCLCWINTVSAQSNEMPTIDVYRTQQLTRQFLQDRYVKDIKKLSDLMYNRNFFRSKNVFHEYERIQKCIISDIKKQGQFAYVGLSVTRYPKETTAHCTIDLVDQMDKRRYFLFLPPPQKHTADPEHLIQSWQAYQKAGFEILSQTNEAPHFKSCPAHHCLFGFEDERLQKYGHLFVKLVPRHQKQLLEILRKDINPEKRAAAAFLFAHIHDGRELIRKLQPSIFDGNSMVRNAVMRVIGSALAKNIHLDFPKHLLLQILDFPEASNRNKALGIIDALVAREEYAIYIKHHALAMLLEELQKSQPNVHDLAYIIFRKISGKQYSEHDYKSWATWVSQQNNGVV